MKTMLRKFSLVPLLLCAFFLLPAGQSFAQTDTLPYEHILDYASDITVNQDRSMVVTETIKVNVTGETIHHGIYRDFPTTYKDNNGLTYRVGFSVKSIEMDGSIEPYHTASLSNGVRVYIGDPNVILDPGVYTYKITYQTNKQLGFFSDHDELYWNVTGNGWDYDIDQVEATVHLPESIPAQKVSLSGFTGGQGSTEQAYTGTTTSTGFTFATSRKLLVNEGLSIVVSWPKGYITPPTTFEKALSFFQDNVANIVAITFPFLLLLYYLLAWFGVGRDPKPGVIIAEYESPEGLSPAAIRYHTKVGYDIKAFTASIINLAVQRVITITETKEFLGKKYTLTKTTDAGASVSTDEAQILAFLFVNGNTIEAKQENYLSFQAAQTSSKHVLETQFQNGYFVFHYPYITLGFLASVVATLACVVSNLAMFFILYIVVLVILNATFSVLLRQRTQKGRALQDKIEGFKLFLSVTEKDHMNFHNPPELTPQLFEQFLPFALALGVENKWAEQFTSVFEGLTSAGTPYTPVWYIGSGFSPNSVGAFGSDFSNSFASAISSASTAPGSSSGGGGGGFSGGGGGGGGGGGW